MVSIVLVPGLSGEARRVALARVDRAATDAGAPPATPTFPGADDASLVRFWQVEAAAGADALAAAIAALDGVDGAYVKPGDEPPAAP